MADDSNDDADGDITSSDVRTVLGTARRDQRWGLTELVEVRTVLGRTRFDLRDARPLNPDDDVEISISCILGTVELLIPYGTRVQLDGTTYLGGSSSDVTETDPDADPDVWSPPGTIPPLDITATVILGRVRVHTPDRPASNTVLTRLIERRRSRKLAKKAPVKAVAAIAPISAPAVLAPVSAGVDVAAAPPPVAAAVDIAEVAPAPVVEPTPAPVAEVAPVTPLPAESAPVVDAAPGPVAEPAPAPSVDTEPRFEPSEPDESALGDTDDWRAEAEAEKADGGWSLSLGGDDEADTDEGGDDGMDGWKILAG